MREKQSYLYDRETGLYNRTVVESFVTKCNTRALFPLAVILFEVKSNSDEINSNSVLFELAKIIKATQNSSMFLARFSNSKIIVFISRCNESSSFKYVEDIANQLDNQNLFNSSSVNVVFDEINKTSPLDPNYLTELEANLQSSDRINLAYII